MFLLYKESDDDTIFIDLKAEIGKDIKKYDEHGLVQNNCIHMKRVQCGDIHSVVNLSDRNSPVYQENDGWMVCKNSRNISGCDIPFMKDSFMLCVYSFPGFKDMYKTAIERSGGNYVSNIKFDIGNFHTLQNESDYHRIGVINTDGSEISINGCNSMHNGFTKGLVFFYLGPGVKLSISGGNRFSMIGYMVNNLNKYVSPILETKKRKYRDLSSDSFTMLNERLC